MRTIQTAKVSVNYELTCLHEYLAGQCHCDFLVVQVLIRLTAFQERKDKGGKMSNNLASLNNRNRPQGVRCPNLELVPRSITIKEKKGRWTLPSLKQPSATTRRPMEPLRRDERDTSTENDRNATLSTTPVW